MSAETTPIKSEPDETPITEKTRAILAAIDRIDKKVDTLIAERQAWKAALYRILKESISLLFPDMKNNQNSRPPTGEAADDAVRAPKTELTTTDDRIYSNEATGATPRRR